MSKTEPPRAIAVIDAPDWGCARDRRAFPAPRRSRWMYEFYCERGQSENMIKNLQNALFADRLSCSDFLANAFRLLLHAVAYRLCLALAKAVEALTGEATPRARESIRPTKPVKIVKTGFVVGDQVRNSP